VGQVRRLGAPEPSDKLLAAVLHAREEKNGKADRLETCCMASEYIPDSDLLRRELRNLYNEVHGDYDQTSALTSRLIGDHQKLGVAVERMERFLALRPGGFFSDRSHLEPGMVESVDGHAGVLSVTFAGRSETLDIEAVDEVIILPAEHFPSMLRYRPDELRALANRCPQTLLVIDCAYAEFADQDPTAALLKHDNVLVVRTFSKAYGLASARIGYALGSADTVATLRRVGSPYPTSSASIDRALERLRDGSGHLAMRVKRTRRERRALSALLKSIGSEVTPSQANFVLARHPRSTWLVEALAGLGIAVRGLGHGQVRLSLPASSGEFARLWRGTSAALRPEALLFDLDGVLADVRRSYRTAIKLTAHQFGVQLSDGAIATAKAWPDSNNDWRVTQRLISAAGGSASLTQVTDTFEAIMDSQRLWERERLIPALELIERLGQERPLGVVTGRPRLDAERFLSDHGLRTLFSAVVTLEDAPAKPDPAPVALALKQLGVRRAWLIGDMPDDMAAARAAGVIPLGVLAPGTSADPMTSQLTRAGAARVLSGLNQLEDLLS